MTSLFIIKRGYFGSAGSILSLIKAIEKNTYERTSQKVSSQLLYTLCSTYN